MNLTNNFTTIPFENEIAGLIKDGKWGDLVEFSLDHPETYPLVFLFYDEIPDNLKYDFVIAAYKYKGDHLPACRKAMRSLKKYGSPVLPDEIKDKDVITVYRAGEEEIDKAKYRISWTADYEVARHWACEYIFSNTRHLLKAKIKTKDIIAYDDGGEKEVMQYGKVFDIEDLPFVMCDRKKDFLNLLNK